MQKAQASEVSIRDFARKDIEPLIHYWVHNPAEYWQARGVDKSRLKSQDEFRMSYETSFAQNGRIPSLAVIVFRNRRIGVHSVNNIIPKESGIFHAHIWDENCRGLEVGVYSYLKAAEHFMKKLKLQKIIYKTPKLNKAAIRVKEKIGIPCLGDTVFESPILFAPLDAKLYELNRPLLLELKKRHGIS